MPFDDSYLAFDGDREDAKGISAREDLVFHFVS
jgi:hypothetical protein